MFAHKYTSALALLAAMAISAEAAPLNSGVCYSPWHHNGGVTEDILQKDYSQVKEHFSSIRTFHARFSGVNVIDSCAKAGLRVAVGVMMKDAAETQKEIEAVCEGAKRHPDTVEAVYVGNENMKNGGHGQYTAGELVNYINQVKGCTEGMNIKVGTVQRINEWKADDAAELIANCDSIGVNIYPFFTPGDKAPIEKFKDQWNELKAKGIPEEKMACTETGWPRQGSTSPQGMIPSKETAQQYLNEFSEWAKGHQDSYYFMMYDTTTAYGGGDYETSFGVADKDGNMVLQVPTGDGSNPYNPAPTPAPTDAPTDSPSQNPTDAPTDAPTDGPTDAPTDSPTKGPTDAPTDSPTKGPTDAPEPKPTEGPKPTDAPTPAPSNDSGKPTDAPVTPAPTTPGVVTPMPTKPHGGGSYNDTKQHDRDSGKHHEGKHCN